MLTIVLPLRNRAEFNGRFLYHVKCRLKFKFFIADGSDVPVFKYTEYPYKYYGPDHTMQRWFTKVQAALEEVDTRFVMIADNDDLPTKDLTRCVDFLEHHQDYVCCSGRIQGFHMWPSPLIGPRSATTKQYSMYDTPNDFSQDSVNDRVLAGFANSWSYYGVYRTWALQQIWKEVCVLGFTDLMVHEKFCAMRTLTLGKALCDPAYTSYYRQYGTSQVAAFNGPNKPSTDILKVLAVMGAEGVDRAELHKRWVDWYGAWASRNEGPWAQLRHSAKARWPRLAWLYQNRHRYFPHQRLEVLE